MSASPDFRVEGSDEPGKWFVRPMTAEAKKHLKQHVSVEGRWIGEAMLVDHRDIGNLVSEIRTAGFIVQI
jgi:hypothetical protein